MTSKQQTGEESSEVRQLSHRPAESGQSLSPSASHQVRAEMQLGVTSKSTSGCPPTDNHNQPPPRRGSAPDRPACSWCTTGKTTPAGSAARPRSPASVQSVGDFVASPSPSCGDRSSLRPSTSCALAPPCAARAQQARTAPRNTRCHMHSEARRLELEGLESLSSTTVVELADELPILGQLCIKDSSWAFVDSAWD